MPKILHIYILISAVVILSSCSVNKFIPDNHYLLDEVNIVSDNEDIKTSQFNTYIRQNPNAKWFNLIKVPMRIYCLSGKDSTKWINKFLRGIGDAPEIFDAEIAERTQKELTKAVRNLGYMQAEVHLRKVTKKNRMKIFYEINSGKPYTIKHLAYHIDDIQISDIMEKDSINTLLQKGMLFNVMTLDQERQRITKLLQNNGYYRFNKDFLTYQADTARNSFSIDLTMRLQPYQRRKEDIPAPHKSYTIRNVNYIASEHTVDAGRLHLLDSLSHKGLNVYYDNRKPFIRPEVIYNFNYIRPGDLYNEEDVQNTITSMGRLHTLKYTNILFDEVTENDSTYLDANVFLTKNKPQSLSFEIEGTNSAGDLGAAASLTYQHRNLFRGSETFTVKVRGAYESITGLEEGYDSDNYKEYGIESSLNFPEFRFPFLSSEFKKKIRATSEVGLKFNSQLRPEFTRTLASASWSYRWYDKARSVHRFDLLDVNYIYVPWKSDIFIEYLENLTDRNSILIKSYEDQLIVRMGYTYSYNSSSANNKNHTYSIRFGIEESGNLLYLASKAFHNRPKDDKGYVIANIPFAQYVKGDFDYAHNFRIDNRNSLVFHIGLGVAYPYGNSVAIPFEKRYFSGGPNSVRGWSVRTLGPGSYKGTEGSINYINHTGDIKLDFNIEYRTHLFWKFNGAAFVDAGNIWNIDHYAGQSEGTFRFHRFYKQLAVAYGLGLRMDLDYLILRFDAGMKAINPMFSGKAKYPFTHPDLKRDFAFHFAVGYPF